MFREESRLKEIGVQCFSGSDVEEMIIPSSVVAIREGAFSDCTALYKISF